MQVIGSQFTHAGEVGDFGWMIKQPEYADALFIFNDNEEQFLDHRNNPKSAYGCEDGGGNATIRHYQCQDPPRAAGIPTGYYFQGKGKGYQNLEESRGEPGKTVTVKTIIDEALDTIKELAQKNNYQRIFYSADQNGDLDTKIFDVGPYVKKYVGEQLRAMGK